MFKKPFQWLLLGVRSGIIFITRKLDNDRLLLYRVHNRKLANYEIR